MNEQEVESVGGDGFLIFHGEAIDALRELPDESIDALVTDPPAGIEFMGKSWDSPLNMNPSGPQSANWAGGRDNPYARGMTPRYTGKGGNRNLEAREAFIENLTPIFAECLRVMKPGAHGLVWSLPRTSHWTATALEDAGFELRDELAHIFGCLDMQSKVLTPTGPKTHAELRVGDEIVGFDPLTQGFKTITVEEVFYYANAYPLVRITGAHHEQLVTGNHLVAVERNGDVVFREAGDLATREREARVPVLEDVRVLLEALSVRNEGTSCTESNVREAMREPLGGQRETGKVPQTGSDLRLLRQSISTEVKSGSQQSKTLFSDMQRQAPRDEPAVSQEHGEDRRAGPVGLDIGKSRTIPHQDDRRLESGVERGRDAARSPRELRLREVRPLPAGSAVDGPTGRVCHGEQSSSSAGDGALLDTNRVRSPHRSQPNEQRRAELDDVQDESRSQALRASRFTRTDLGRVEDVVGSAPVWCIRTSTGAFVAERNGAYFVTGNSGFPKSHNLDGEWEGWGTALKPSREDWILIRKPINQTVAKNVVEFGTGALNIDASRISVTDAAYAHNCSGDRGHDGTRAEIAEGGTNIRAGGGQAAEGRWPANTLLSHSAECVIVGEQHACVPGCAVRMLDDQVGIRKSGVMKAKGRRKASADLGGYADGFPDQYTPVDRGGDSGGVSRFFYTGKVPPNERLTTIGKSAHPTQKSVALMTYLTRLITPPGGVILDPFLGSGTTGVAALQQAFEFIGVERDEQYLAWAYARLVAAKEKK
jgi:site-specific DNA-methyltransferase (adenine-specific)